ncbi:hypothetical protein PQ459_16205 [Chryseobacterium sp. KACC 21268]|nr:hypothetical protein PQ459_16205 [Chryseobacterium sp. KACC 21268]
MKTRILLTALIMLFCLNHATAQSHKVGQANYNCKLNKKGWFFNSEKYPCPACQAKDDKEKAAKNAEDKRREDIIKAKIAADKKAAEVKQLENQRLAKEEEQRKKAKEAADKVANENASRRYKEIAAKGMMKSNVKGQNLDVDLSKVESFADDKRKVYGFKLNDEEVMTFPFDEKNLYIRRIKGSNLFIVDTYGNEKYSYLIDITGQRIIVDGNDKVAFRGIEENEADKVIYFNKNHSIEKTGKRADAIGNSAWGKFYKTRESALADVDYYESRRTKGGLVSLSSVALWFNTRYILDYNGNILEKSDGYLVTQY